jgi:hypothetical protein
MAITGTIKDSLRSALSSTLLTQLSSVAAQADAIYGPEAVQDLPAGAVSITPPPNGGLVPAGTTYTFRVQDASGVQRLSAAGVTVTAAMDTLDEIL